MFLSVIGPTTYKLLASLIAPDKPGDKDYKELVKVLQEHHNSTPSEIVQRYKFHTRIQQPGKLTTQFIAELRALAQYCNFGASSTDLLRDCIVCVRSRSKKTPLGKSTYLSKSLGASSEFGDC